MQVIDVRRIFVRGDGEDIDVVQHRRYDRRFCPIVFYRLVFELDQLGLLEAQFRGELLHLVVEMFAHLRDVPLQDFLYLGNVLLVLLQGLQALARPLAAFDVVFETNFVSAFPDTFRCERVFAGADRVQLLQKLQHDLGHIDRRVGAEVPRAVAHDIPRLIDPREILVLDHDGRIGLPIFQEDVIARLVLLD